MSQLTKLPDLAKSFAKMKIILDLQTKVLGSDLISLAIQTAFHNKENPDLIIRYIKEQATDNLPMMQSAIGVDLTNRIMKL